jgi:hypothetical protein
MGCARESAGFQECSTDSQPYPDSECDEFNGKYPIVHQADPPMIMAAPVAPLTRYLRGG